MTDPDILSLRLFLAIVELGNLTRAAQRNAIAPSAVTKRIQDLERHYGVELFRRQSRGVVPTIAGEELSRHVRDLFHRMDHVEGTMSQFVQGSRGQVRVHANATVLLEGLIASIASFNHLHPFIRVELKELMSWAIVRDVVENRADLGLVSDTVEIPSDLTTAVYAEDRLMVLLPADHPLILRGGLLFEEILDFAIIGIGATSALSVQLAEKAGGLNRSIRYAYRTATYDVARMMVAEGCGAAVLPSSLVLPHVSDRLIAVPLTDAWARRKMRLCYREEASLTVAARLFIDHLMQRKCKNSANEPHDEPESGFSLS